MVQSVCMPLGLVAMVQGNCTDMGSSPANDLKFFSSKWFLSAQVDVITLSSTSHGSLWTNSAIGQPL